MTPKTALKILQISDLHILPEPTDTMLGLNTEYYFQACLKHAHQQFDAFDLILVTGDLAQDPCPGSYQRIVQQLQNYQTPCMCLPGNHDDFEMMSQCLNRDQITCNKLLQMNGWQIIGLNSQKQASPIGKLSPDELVFLQKTLSARPDMPTLIALHHPCIATGSAWLDVMQIENSAEFLSLLQQFPQVKAVTCGHVHQEIYAEIEQIKLFSAPASCFQFTPKSTNFSIDDAAPGYRIFELFEDGSLKSACHRLPVTLDTLDRSARQY